MLAGACLGGPRSNGCRLNPLELLGLPFRRHMVALKTIRVLCLRRLVVGHLRTHVAYVQVLLQLQGVVVIALRIISDHFLSEVLLGHG